MQPVHPSLLYKEKDLLYAFASGFHVKITKIYSFAFSFSFTETLSLSTNIRTGIDYSFMGAAGTVSAKTDNYPWAEQENL